MVLIEPGDYLYQSVTPERVREIVRDHIVLGLPVKEMLYKNEAYFKKQHRLVLRNAGKIDPSRIQDYISAGGYSALAKCLSNHDSARRNIRSYGERSYEEEAAQVSQQDKNGLWSQEHITLPNTLLLT